MVIRHSFHSLEMNFVTFCFFIFPQYTNISRKVKLLYVQ